MPENKLDTEQMMLLFVSLTYSIARTHVAEMSIDILCKIFKIQRSTNTVTVTLKPS